MEFRDSVDDTVSLETAVDFDQGMILVNVIDDKSGGIGIYLSADQALALASELRSHASYLDGKDY